MFHAYSGCDAISVFSGKGKKSAWRAWQIYDDIKEVFLYWPNIPSSGWMSKNWLLSCTTNPVLWAPLTRREKELFCHENRGMEKLSPTQDALLQHIKRAVHQAGVRASSTQTQQVVPSPQDYAWTRDSGSWVPVWLTIGEVSEACKELIIWFCKGDCSTCSCDNTNLGCSPLCK